MNVDHNSAREMSDWESFAEMMAAIGVLPSSYISCAWGLLWVHGVQEGGIPNEVSFYANPAALTDQVTASLC